MRPLIRHPMTIAALTVAALASPWAAAAQPAPAEAPQAKASAPLSKGEIKAIREFHMLDFNGDGKLSRKEVAIVPRLYSAFDDADTNKDNYVTLEEVRAYTIKYRAAREKAKAEAAEQERKQASAANTPATSK